MGAELGKTGKMRVGDDDVQILADVHNKKRLHLNMPGLLLHLLITNDQTTMALELLQELALDASVQEERSKSRGRKEESHPQVQDLTKDQLQVLQQVKVAFGLQRNQHSFLTSVLLWLRKEADFKQHVAHECEENNKDKSREKGQQYSNSPSKQFKKVNFQTYEYLSKDVIKENSEEGDSYDSGSLGEDTEENVRNMNLDWNVNRKNKKTQNIGTTLKNLVTQSSLVSAINIGSAQGKHHLRLPLQEDICGSKENKLPGEVSGSKRMPEDKNSAMLVNNSTANQAYRPRSYAGIYKTKRGQNGARAQEHDEVHLTKEKDGVRQVELRNIRGITDHQPRNHPHTGEHNHHNFHSFMPEPNLTGRYPKIEKRLTYTDFE